MFQKNNQLKRPLRVGGMATPLGVYLTTGNLRAGAGDLGLFFTGVIMTVFYILIFYIINIFFALFPFLAEDISANVFIDIIILFLFLFFLRLSPLSGYHAAEHQTINAIENNLELNPVIVARMQRFHPRCGTNIVALLISAQIMIAILTPLFLLDFSLLLIIFITLVSLTWRPLGRMVQLFFTTKKPSNNQILSGIKAGEDILRKYNSNPYYKANFFKKLWNVGLLQVIGGWFITFLIIYLIDLWTGQ